MILYETTKNNWSFQTILARRQNCLLGGMLVALRSGYTLLCSTGLSGSILIVVWQWLRLLGTSFDYRMTAQKLRLVGVLCHVPLLGARGPNVDVICGIHMCTGHGNNALVRYSTLQHSRWARARFRLWIIKNLGPTKICFKCWGEWMFNAECSWYGKSMGCPRQPGLVIFIIIEIFWLDKRTNEKLAVLVPLYLIDLAAVQ